MGAIATVLFTVKSQLTNLALSVVNQILVERILNNLGREVK